MSNERDLSQPVPPNPAFTRHIASETDENKQTMRYHEPTQEGAPAELSEKLESLIDGMSEDIVGCRSTSTRILRRRSKSTAPSRRSWRS